MPRRARIVAPGIPHHVTQRGNRRQQVFFSDADYRNYIAILTKHSRSEGLSIWCYCLMPNHVHLIVVPSTETSLAKAIGRTHSDYARIINDRERWQGHLWQARFASFPMDEGHLVAATRYVLLNPVVAGIVRRPEEWKYSSARAHLTKKSDGPTDIKPLDDRIANWSDVFVQGATEKERTLFRKSSKAGRPLGSSAFVESIAQRTGQRFSRKPRGRPRLKPEAVSG